ncbi:MAG TPA: S41 family peptidase [Bryobacteraceae bacterium]|jgi:C-terminal processing protease CtpA/Prc
MFRRLPLVLLVSALSFAQTGPLNPDFEDGAPGSAPAAWFQPPVMKFQVSWTGDGCFHGKGCAQLVPGPDSGAAPGNLMQMIDAAPYRGKLIRYRAAVNSAAGARAGLWLRVDLPGGRMGFFDNMTSRPIMTGGQWQYFQIDGFVTPDAEKIGLGILAYAGAVRIDDVTLTPTGDLPKIVEEPARPLTEAGLRNLVAFTRLFGIVRHFHPSDEAAAADWNKFTIEAVRQVEAADSPAALASVLQSVFAPVAPTLRVYTGAEPKLPVALEPGPNLQLTRWRNKGFGQSAQNMIYNRRRVKSPGAALTLADLYRIELAPGVTAIVPLAVFTDDQGTLPHPGAPHPPASPVPPAALSANDRATRLADVVIAWNVFQHFYPYFDVAKTDWPAVLPVTLKEAAVDKDGSAFHITLEKLVAELKDGHGRVGFNGQRQMGRAPISAAWIEGKYIVTDSAAPDRIKPGDEIVAIDGKPSADVLADAEKLISGATPQWKRSRSAGEALLAPRGESITLTVRPFHSTESSEVRLVCEYTGQLRAEPRPKAVVAELEPGIWYIDLTRARDQDFDAALPKFETAKGIVFDMRGYPSVSPAWFSHVTKTPLRSAQWHVPLVDRPGEMTFEREGEWNLPAREPYLAARKVFLTNGGAISYAESTMGIVEYYKLGEIVGEATAGTNGNVNPFELPGGYTVSWTGMKVLKHDGSRHHAVGILPTIPASRTQAGVAAGRDEILDRGIAALK